VVRVVDHDVKPGVQVDMGDGDEWPAIQEKLLAADILVFATPTWVGAPTPSRPWPRTPRTWRGCSRPIRTADRASRHRP
jgi:hypothetical protein